MRVWCGGFSAGSIGVKKLLAKPLSSAREDMDLEVVCGNSRPWPWLSCKVAWLDLREDCIITCEAFNVSCIQLVCPRCSWDVFRRP